MTWHGRLETGAEFRGYRRKQADKQTRNAKTCEGERCCPRKAETGRELWERRQV